jgi:hypothetical protein
MMGRVSLRVIASKKGKGDNGGQKRSATMSEVEGTSLEACFGDLPDPRVVGRCDHKLMDMIMIAVCAVICRAESWVGVETFGKAQAELAEAVFGIAQWHSHA